MFEYYRNDAFDAPNYFDTAARDLPKSTLKQNQFGGSVGGPFMKDKAFFFGSYEGYRLDAGVNFVEAVPSDAAWARAVPGDRGAAARVHRPSAVILPGASTNPDFDIAQLQGLQNVNENSFSAPPRLPLQQSSGRCTCRVFHDQGDNNQPKGVSGRVVDDHRQSDQRACSTCRAYCRTACTNEFKFGYNAAADAASTAWRR